MTVEVFDWEEFRQCMLDYQPTRAAMIVRAFEQYVKGNDSFKDMSTAEMEDQFQTFKSGWLLSEMISRASRR